MQELLAKQTELMGIEAQKFELLKKLAKADRIKKVWPDAFSTGVCEIYRKFESYVEKRHPNKQVDIAWRPAYGILERSDGVKQKITLKQYDYIKEGK